MFGKIEQTTVIILSFTIALIGMLGSLFFSEVMSFIPCSLCWYQRIFLYPLVFIFLVNLLYPDEKVYKYTFPLVVIGFTIAVYHNLLVYKVIPETISPCVQGVPCSTTYINWFGFVTIPLLSLIAYGAILVLLILGKKGKFKDEK